MKKCVLLLAFAAGCGSFPVLHDAANQGQPPVKKPGGNPETLDRSR